MAWSVRRLLGVSCGRTGEMSVFGAGVGERDSRAVE